MITYKEAEFWMRVTLAVLALALFLTVHAIYWPAIVSLILTFILMPIRDVIIKGFLRLTGRKLPTSIAILISFVVFIFIVTVITNSIVKPLVIQTNLLAANFSNLVNRTADLVAQIENEQTQLYIPDQVKRIINDAFTKVSNYGIDGITNLLQSVFVIAGTVVEFFVVPIITFYFMKDGSRMVRTFVGIFPAGYRDHLASLFLEIQHVLSRYIRGQILMSCIIAVLTFIGMWAMGVPYPMVIALLAAITEWIPIVGPIVGAAAPIIWGLDRSGAGREGTHLLRRHSTDRQPPHHAPGHGCRYQTASGGHHHSPAHRRDPLWHSRHDPYRPGDGSFTDSLQTSVVLQFL